MCYLPRKEKVAMTEGAGKMGQIRKGLEHHTQTQDFYRFLYFVFAYFNFTFPTFFFSPKAFFCPAWGYDHKMENLFKQLNLWPRARASVQDSGLWHGKSLPLLGGGLARSIRGTCESQHSPAVRSSTSVFYTWCRMIYGEEAALGCHPSDGARYWRLLCPTLLLASGWLLQPSRSTGSGWGQWLT